MLAISTRAAAPRIRINDMAMDTFHVITLVPLTRKSVIRLGSLTVLVAAEEGVLAMVVHSVGFSFVAKEASIRREPLGCTLLVSLGMCANVRPDVRVQIFAVGLRMVSLFSES